MKITIFLIIVAAILIGAWYFESQRREGLDKIADSIGFVLEPGQQRLADSLDSVNFYLFNQGQPLVQNLMRGELNGDHIEVFNYSYTASEGFEGSRELPNLSDEGRITTYMQTVACFLDIKAIPHFDLSPKDGSKRTLNSEFRSVGFDDAHGFTQHYNLAAREEASVRLLFNDELLAHFAHDPGWVVESRGRQVIFYHKDERLKPERIADFIEQAQAHIERFRLSQNKREAY
ncbi:MAG: hypothetical protein KZQ84_17340 [Candidatus Thiodiazotropha sp. (ex Lucinoma borealis)]|nr:hypothetical protein [Candidatus Thiodiazotropha sp. (ex Lucinoma borealis)]